MKNLVVLLLILLSFNSCKKEVDSANNTNPIDTVGFKALFRIEYNVDSNNVVKCYNLSSKYKKIKWLFSDNFTSLEPNPIHKFDFILNNKPWVTLYAEDETGRTDSFKISYINSSHEHGYINANVILIDINPVKYAVYKSPDYFASRIDFFTFFDGNQIDTILYTNENIVIIPNKNSNNFRLYTKESDYVSIYVNIPTVNIDTILSKTSKITNHLNVYNRYSIIKDLNKPDIYTSFNDTLIPRTLTNGIYLKIKDSNLDHTFEGNVYFETEYAQKLKPNVINFLLPNKSVSGSSNINYNGIEYNYQTGQILGRIYSNSRGIYIYELVYECQL